MQLNEDFYNLITKLTMILMIIYSITKLMIILTMILVLKIKSDYDIFFE